ncbi:TPA: hypothetical protein ACOTG0_001210 [Clostridium perfringens]
MKKQVLVFAHGFNINYEQIKPLQWVDVCKYTRNNI